MRNGRVDLTRRQYLAASAGLVAAGLGGARPAFALETVRQGVEDALFRSHTRARIRARHEVEAAKRSS